MVKQYEQQEGRQLKQSARQQRAIEEAACLVKKQAEGYTCRRCKGKFESNTKLHEHVRTKHAKRPKGEHTTVKLPSPPPTSIALATPPSPPSTSMTLATPPSPPPTPTTSIEPPATPTATSISLFPCIHSNACFTLSSLARLFSAFSSRSSFEAVSDGRIFDRDVCTIDICLEVLSTTAPKALVTSDDEPLPDQESRYPGQK